MTEQEKLTFTQSALQAQPTLPKWHFISRCGIGKRFLDKWEKEGLVTFAPQKTWAGNAMRGTKCAS